MNLELTLWRLREVWIGLAGAAEGRGGSSSGPYCFIYNDEVVWCLSSITKHFKTVVSGNYRSVDRWAIALSGPAWLVWVCWASLYIRSELAGYWAADGLGWPRSSVWRWTSAWLGHLCSPLRGLSSSGVGVGYGSDSVHCPLFSPLLPLAGPLI